MKKRIGTLLLAACLLLSLTLQAIAVNDLEENNTSQTAQSFTLGDTISGTIEPNDDVDFYQFTLPESGRVSLDITSHMNSYRLYLYDTEGTEWWNSGWMGYNETVGFREDVHEFYLESETYFIQVMGRNESAGNYSIETSFVAANATETEPNNSVGDANAIDLGSTILGLIGTNDEYDFYEFTLSEPGRVTLDITSYMEIYSLFIYDTTGTELWKTEGNEYNSTVKFRKDSHFVDLERGTFYLRVSGHKYGDWGSATTGTYQIETSFARADTNESEPNNGADEANATLLGDTMLGLIGSNDRFDFYRFSLSENTKISIDFTSYMQFYSLTIYDGEGTEQWDTGSNEYNETTGFRKDIHEIDLEGGTYYLRVSGYKYGTWGAESTGTYTFTIDEASVYIPVEEISLSPATLELKEGSSATLIVTIKPDNATDQSVNWSSNDMRVVELVRNGKITAVSPGRAIITAEAGDRSAECVVTVTEKETVIGETSDWAKEEIKKAEEMDLIPEVLQNEDLTQDITRAEFAAVAVKTFENLSGGKAVPVVNNPFRDTRDVEVLKAYEIGAVNGTSADTFGPNELLNREQCATMLTRVFKRITLAGWTLEKDSQFKLDYIMPGRFNDDGDISSWAKDSVYFMAANGIINGIGNNKFAPKNVTSAQEAEGYANATREQALAIAVRMVENLGNETPATENGVTEAPSPPTDDIW